MSSKICHHPNGPLYADVELRLNRTKQFNKISFFWWTNKIFPIFILLVFWSIGLSIHNQCDPSNKPHHSLYRPPSEKRNCCLFYTVLSLKLHIGHKRWNAKTKTSLQKLATNGKYTSIGLLIRTSHLLYHISHQEQLEVCLCADFTDLPIPLTSHFKGVANKIHPSVEYLLRFDYTVLTENMRHKLKVKMIKSWKCVL